MNIGANIDIVYILIVLIVVLVSMTFHEAMHAYVGYWLGDNTAKLHGRLSFNPLKHIDPFLTVLLPLLLAVSGGPVFGAAKPVPFNPNNVRFGEWGSALIATAGPLTNLFIAFVVFGAWLMAGAPDQGIWGQIFITAVSVNLGFFVFNLIPIPPLDGSRVLYALAPEFVKRGMEAIEQFGLLFIFAIIIFADSAFGTIISAALRFFTQVFARIYGV